MFIARDLPFNIAWVEYCLNVENQYSAGLRILLCDVPMNSAIQDLTIKMLNRWMKNNDK